MAEAGAESTHGSAYGHAALRNADIYVSCHQSHLHPNKHVHSVRAAHRCDLPF